jgi:hypothetical protein
VLLDVRDRNQESLELLTAAVDAAIQYVYAQSFERFAPGELHGAVLGANVRNNVIWYGARPEFRASTLRLSRGPNCSVQIVDRLGQDMKLRKHPRNARTGMLVGVRPGTSQTLFGDAPDPDLWSIAVLWDPNPVAQALGHAWLAALADGDKPLILDRIGLPIGSPTLLTAPGTEGRPSMQWEPQPEDVLDEEQDDFNDYFEGDEGDEGEAMPGA